jgi:hypothetical protein
MVRNEITEENKMKNWEVYGLQRGIDVDLDELIG